MRVCFIHVPKAAGMSVLSVMSAHFGGGNVFPVYDSHLCSVPIAYLLRRHDVIGGHFSVRYLSNEVLESAFVFTFLRDPLERVLSHYGYFRDLSHESNDPDVALARTQNLTEILRCRIDTGRFTPWTNLQTMIFSGCDSDQPATSETLSRAKHNLEQLAFVGIQDELREGVATLLRIWGGTDLLELPNLNRTVERLPSHLLDTETHRLIEESNWLDRELYLHARELWRSRHVPEGKPDLKTNLLGRAERGSREIVIMSLMIESDVEAGCRVYPRKPWTLRLTLDSVVIEANLTIGIKISDAIGLELYGTNSFLQGRSFAVGPGEFIVRIDFPEVTLAPGRYFITAALHTGFASDEKCYHWVENALEFQVMPEDALTYVGALDLAARFRACSKSNAPETSVPGSDVNLAYGTKVSFATGGNSEPLRVSGWSATESQMTWTQGTAAVLAMRVSSTNEPVVLRMKLAGLTKDPELPYQPVEVYVNDQKVADWQVVADPAEFSASIPQEITRRGGLLRITLKIPKAISPKALGMGADPRILGVACFDLQLALKAG